MNNKFKYLILGIIAITLINIVIKITNYFTNYKVHKYGIKVPATIIGYFAETVMDVNLDKRNNDYLKFYPIIKFTDVNGNELTAKINYYSLFPIHKIGEKTTIRYYKRGKDNIINGKMYINKIGTKQEDIGIFTNVNVAFTDLKHNIDIIIEVIIILLLIFIKSMFK